MKGKVYYAANLRITCDEQCPFFYCNEPCRVQKHAESYAKIIKQGFRCNLGE